MSITVTPLRYPGGKTQIALFVEAIIRANDLAHGTYVEPFAGGFGVGLKLLYDNVVEDVVINDIDRGIHAFWACAVNQNDALCQRIKDTHVTIDEWHRQKDVLLTKGGKQLDLAFATFFLNRTNRSGILKGGVIGGKSQDGAYLLDCRYNKDDLISKIERIHIYRERIRVMRKDANTFLRQISKVCGTRSLLNIDPPYYQKGQGLYTNFYVHDDHVQLAKTIRSLHRPWMLTYDNAEEIRSLYKGLPQSTMELNYFAQVKRLGVELLVTSRSLQPPFAEVAA